MTIEIVDLPIKHGDFPYKSPFSYGFPWFSHRFLSVYQAGYRWFSRRQVTAHVHRPSYWTLTSNDEFHARRLRWTSIHPGTSTASFASTCGNSWDFLSGNMNIEVMYIYIYTHVEDIIIEVTLMYIILWICTVFIYKHGLASGVIKHGWDIPELRAHLLVVFRTTPLKNDGVNVSWDDYSQYMEK